MERFCSLFGSQVQFSYTALDRIVLAGYLERLQRPEHLVYFFHDVAGVPCIEPAVLAERTERYRNWVRRYTAEQGIPVLPAARGVRKEEVVQPYYRRLRGKEGVACVLTSMEQDGTFVSYTRFRTSDPNYRRISRCRKQFLHYYFYVLDEVAGPMSLRVATYLPSTSPATSTGTPSSRGRSIVSGWASARKTTPSSRWATCERWSKRRPS